MTMTGQNAAKTEQKASAEPVPAPAAASAEPAGSTVKSILPARPEVELDRTVLMNRGIVGFEQSDPRTRPFSLLRSQIKAKMAKREGRIIAITSTQPNNGKSFIASNLAAAMSKIMPTCLVDLDLRRPSIADYFELPPGVGVDNYLMEQGLPVEPGCQVAGENLIILPAYEPQEGVAPLLTSDRMPLLFNRLRHLPNNPIVLIDTPPILECDDMLIIAKHVDAVLLVIEEGRTSERDVREALRLLEPGQLIGTVLNKSISTQMLPNYSRYYSYSENLKALENDKKIKEDSVTD